MERLTAIGDAQPGGRSRSPSVLLRLFTRRAALLRLSGRSDWQRKTHTVRLI
jgi:hypothetical protein